MIVPPPRTLIIDQGDIYNQRRLKKEVLSSSMYDQNDNNIPTQIWYDSLRETDDGRFVNLITEREESPKVEKKKKSDDHHHHHH